ncbi:9739_t:CDS:2 [Diversispora eburnea]|uniref:9739_t:CDS:1 n=1 Tax=Diversispora eburnea TaxID=1213867 RepID=A0A9N9ARL3_9GLOM|nr:9739_t:CDS:2 [Diversispora eburnea]
MNSNNSSHLCVFFLAALLTFVPIVRANCSNSAVYSSCKQRESSNSALCTSTDFVCKCSAVKAISECYRQCTDDPNIVAEAEAYSLVVKASCSVSSYYQAFTTTRLTSPTKAKQISSTPTNVNQNNSKNNGVIVFVGFTLFVIGLIVGFTLVLCALYFRSNRLSVDILPSTMTPSQPPPPYVK